MKTGVIVANTGSPASPEPDDVEAYLREFLMDDRIRQLPRPIWRHLLYKRILPKRKFTSAARYRFIWSPEGSPLVVRQRQLCELVQAAFDAGAPAGDVVVRSAMSYGEPSITAVLQELRNLGCARVVLLPLYPQSAFSPTQAVIDAFRRAQNAIGWHPSTIVIDNYHDDPAYIRAIAGSIRAAGYDPSRDDHLVLSFHAIPLKDERAGDTYRTQVRHTAALVAAELGIAPDAVTVSYQSVFGPRKDLWVSPLTVDVLAGWRDETFRVVFCCPGFAVDCLETLYDIPHDMVPALEGEAAAPTAQTVGQSLQAACNTSGRFVWVPCLDATDEHARVIHGVIARRLTEGREA